jgi:hypothetical protein
MSTRLFNFREGDRSEYLALYLLSGLGLVTQVPRQEDIGFDFVCSLADQELGRLSFKHQYLTSVKSLSNPAIELEPTEKGGESLPHLEWLFNLDLPLFLAVVDKATLEVAMYSTLPIWFIHYECFDCGAVQLSPRTNPENVERVARPVRESEIAILPGRYKYRVDLGHPIARISPQTLQDNERLRHAKSQLRKAIYYARISKLHSELGIPHFYWFAITTPDCTKSTPAFFYNSVPDIREAQEQVFGEIAPTLVSLAMLYKENGNTAKISAITELLREVPRNAIPELIRSHLPEIFK